MSKLTLIGNLTGDPEVRSTPNGVIVCAFTSAGNRRYMAGFSNIPNDDIPF